MAAPAPRPLCPTLFRTAGKSAIAGGADARVSTDVRLPRSHHAQYRVSRAAPGANVLYPDDHVDHSARAVHYARKQPPDASTTKTPETRPITCALSGPTGAHGSLPTANHDSSYLERST